MIKSFLIAILIVIKISFRHILQICTIKIKLYKTARFFLLYELFILNENESLVISVTASRLRQDVFWVEFFVYQIHILLILNE